MTLEEGTLAGAMEAMLGSAEEGLGGAKGMLDGAKEMLGGARGDESEALLVQCQELVETFRYDEALEVCSRILAQDPRHIGGLLMKATVAIDQGKVEEAVQILNEAIAIEPEDGFEKYTALAQLSVGDDALRLFEKAVAILTRIAASLRGEEEEDGCGVGEDELLVRAELSSIYCSMADLYLTDLCFHEAADVKCEELIGRAMEMVPSNYEALQTLANMRLSQNRRDDAIAALGESIGLWREMPFEDEHYPSYEFRLTAARLLVEVELYEDARQIAAVLTQEDDDIVESWYLYTFALYSLGETAAAHAALQNAERLIAGGGPENGEQLGELFDAILELREAIGIDAAQPADGGEGGEDDDGQSDDCSEVSDDDSDGQMEM